MHWHRCRMKSTKNRRIGIAFADFQASFYRHRFNQFRVSMFIAINTDYYHYFWYHVFIMLKY